MLKKEIATKIRVKKTMAIGIHELLSTPKNMSNAKIKEITK